jgi:hypothetical protein
MKAGLWAIVSVWLVSAIRKATRMDFRAVLKAAIQPQGGCAQDCDNLTASF